MKNYRSHNLNTFIRLFILLYALGFSTSMQGQRVHAIVEDMLDDVNCLNNHRQIWRKEYTIRLINENAKDMASFVLDCDNTHQLSKFSMNISDATGHVVRKVKKGELKVTAYNPDMVSNAMRYYFNYEPTSYPVIINVQMEVEITGGIASFPSFQPITTYQTEVRHAQYRLLTPADMKVHFITQHLSSPVTTTPQPNGNTLTAIEIKDLPALQREPLSLPIYERLPMAWFVPETFSLYKTYGSTRSWKEFGQWQYGLLQGRNQLPESLKNQLLELTSNCNTPREKIERLYQFLRQTTRYVSIQLGIGGWQPATAENVYKTGMGDCKGLTNYMKAMLEAVGIESHYTIIHTNRHRLFKDFVSINQFNHAILQIPLPQDTLWVECTNPTLPLGYLHDDIANHDCLIIKADGGYVARVPNYPETHNRTINKATIQLQENGDADIAVAVNYEAGDYADAYYMQFLEQKKQNEYVAQLASLPQSRYTDLHWTDTITAYGHPMFSITTNAKSAGYGKKTGARMFFPLNPFHNNYIPYSKSTERTQDIFISQGDKVVDTIVIILPEKYRIEALPDNTTIETPCGYFSTDITTDGQQIKAVFTRNIKEGRYKHTIYEQLLEDMAAISRAYQGRVVIVK